jgi:hypothetical protein
MPFTDADVNGILRYTSHAITIVEVHLTDMSADRDLDVGIEAFLLRICPTGQEILLMCFLKAF